MNIICEKKYSDWRELISDLSRLPDDKYIFRGQSNSYLEKFNQWEIISSFNRFYPKGTYNFRTFLHQQLSDIFFKKVYSDYKYTDIRYLLDCSQLERLYYLQHYGIPTCFIDFTKDPLVALFFAMSTVKVSNSIIFDIKGNPLNYPDDCYISIYGIDYNKIQDLLGIRSISPSDIESNYDLFLVDNSHIGFDINPIDNLRDKTHNYNLEAQKGSFILYDNNNTYRGLLGFLQYQIVKIDRDYDDILVNVFHLQYNSLFKRQQSRSIDRDTLFSYLNRTRKTGKYLFNDIQGLKYDINFFHN